MQVSRVTLSNISNSKNQKVSNQKIQNQPSFSGWSFPSGEYSDWFVKFIEDISKKYRLGSRIEGIEPHLIWFAKDTRESREEYVLHSFKWTIDKDVKLRFDDCMKLLGHFDEKQPGKHLGWQNYDDIKDEYSSLRDYNRRHNAITSYDPPEGEGRELSPAEWHAEHPDGI